jgi:excisionase family DNA binding protein
MSTLFTASEIAARLRIALPTVRLWTRTAAMPHLRMGRLIRYRIDDVLAWLEAGGPRQRPEPRE